MTRSSHGKLGAMPPARGPAAVRRARGLPAFSLAVGRGPAALDEDDREEAPELAPAPAPEHAAPIAPAALAASAERLDVSQPGDPLERDADRTADEALHRLTAPGGAAADPPLPPPAFAPRPLVQRASLVEVAAEATGLTRPDGAADRAGGLLVDDETQALTPGQMKKTPFLDELRRVACEATDRELRKVGRTADGCPYLDQILARYAHRPAAALERSIRRYAPEARSATRALEYLGPVATRLGHGVAAWTTTGRMPDGLSTDLMTGGLLEGGLFAGGPAAGAPGATQEPAAGAPQLKTADGHAGRSGVDAAALAGQLGPGQPLDGAARGRMESAFGYPFGDVRVHADDRAAALARELDARAFTLGPHIAFGAGELRPGTPAGDALLAHELAHVVQQRGAAPASAQPIDTAAPAHERDADDAAASATLALYAPGLGHRARPRQAGPLQLRRCGARQAAAPNYPLSPLAREVEQRWRDTRSKGRVFDLLRARSPVRDPSLDQVLTRIFAAGTDDLWLAQTIYRYGPEPLWPAAALTERHRRRTDHDWDPEPGDIGATLATTAGGRPVQAFFFPGQTDQRALIISGVHGSEQGGMEVVEMLLADMRIATQPPYYTVIIVPVLFPDNAETRSREGSTPTNRNFPAPGTSLVGATGADGVPRDTSGREILTENVALIQLVERFHPSRICTVHGTYDRDAAGVFSDRHTVSAGARTRARATHAGDPDAAAAAERSLETAAAARTAEDSALAISMARTLSAAGHARAVRGNRLGGRPTSGWSGEVPGGTSLGGWGPQDVTEGGSGDRPSMTVITVEVPENYRSTDRRGRAASARRLELLAFRDVIRDIFLGPPGRRR